MFLRPDVLQGKNELPEVVWTEGNDPIPPDHVDVVGYSY